MVSVTLKHEVHHYALRPMLNQCWIGWCTSAGIEMFVAKHCDIYPSLPDIKYP